MTFPEFQGAIANQGRKGDADTREELSRDNSAALGQGSGSSSRNIHNNIFEFFHRTETPNKRKMLMKHYSFQKKDLQTQLLDHLNTSFEKQCKPSSSLILINSPIFHSQTIKPPPSLSQGGDNLLWPPLPGKAIKLSFSPSPSPPKIIMVTLLSVCTINMYYYVK